MADKRFSQLPDFTPAGNTGDLDTLVPVVDELGVNRRALLSSVRTVMGITPNAVALFYGDLKGQVLGNFFDLQEFQPEIFGVQADFNVVVKNRRLRNMYTSTYEFRDPLQSISYTNCDFTDVTDVQFGSGNYAHQVVSFTDCIFPQPDGFSTDFVNAPVITGLDVSFIDDLQYTYYSNPPSVPVDPTIVDLRPYANCTPATLEGDNITGFIVGSTNVQYLAVYFCSITAHDFTAGTTLQAITVGNSQATSINVSNLGSLNSITLDNNNMSNLVSINIDNCPQLIYVDLTYAGFPEAMVDYILATLEANGLTNGTVNISLGPIAPPSAAGLVSKGILESRGWNVVTN